MFAERKALVVVRNKILPQIILSLLLICSLVSCADPHDPIVIVEKFLKEPDRIKKMKYVRKEQQTSFILLDSLLHHIPDKYLTIRHAQEFVDDKEIIIDVVVGKIDSIPSLGSLDDVWQIFMFKVDGKYKIDLAATAVPIKNELLREIIKNGDQNPHDLKLLLTSWTIDDPYKTINGDATLMGLIAQCSLDVQFFITNEQLERRFQEIFNTNKDRKPGNHLIVRVRQIDPSEKIFIIDSLVQKGWVSGK